MDIEGTRQQLVLSRTEPLVRSSDLAPANRRDRCALGKLRENFARHPLHSRILDGSARARDVNKDIHSLKEHFRSTLLTSKNIGTQFAIPKAITVPAMTPAML
jgi:hypothetical protein